MCREYRELKNRGFDPAYIALFTTFVCVMLCPANTENSRTKALIQLGVDGMYGKTSISASKDCHATSYGSSHVDPWENERILLNVKLIGCYHLLGYTPRYYGVKC